MPINKDDNERIQQLRARRMRVAEKKEQFEKRARYGGSVVAKVNSALGMDLTIESFDVTRKLPIQFEERRDFKDCPGLVVAHASERRLRKILECCDSIVGSMNGVLGFGEYSYVGTAEIESVTMTALLGAARSLHDSVLFCPSGKNAIILLDYYRVRGVRSDVHFSGVIQGTDLEETLAACFEYV